MAQPKMENETYSLIFTSLKHPIRRSILRMLAAKPLMFSEIQDTLGIDSGHLSYHIETLGELVHNVKNGQYQLSSFGRAAVKLMSGVEEHTPTTSQRRKKQRRLFTKFYSVALALMVVFASVYCMSYVTAVPADPEIVRMDFDISDSSIGVNEFLDFNVTLVETVAVDGTQTITVYVDSKLITQLNPRLNTLTEWYKDSMWIEIEPTNSYSTNLGYETYVVDASPVFLTGNSYEVNFNQNLSNGNVFVMSMLPYHNTSIYLWHEGSVETATFFSIPWTPSTVSVEVQSPDGTTTTSILGTSSGSNVPGTVSLFEYPNWFSSPNAAKDYSSSVVPVNQLGTYILNVTNNGTVSWDENFSLYIKSQCIQKPFFYGGMLGLVIAIGYLILVATNSIVQNNRIKRLNTPANVTEN